MVILARHCPLTSYYFEPCSGDIWITSKIGDTSMVDLHFLSLRLTEKYSDISVCLRCISWFFFLVKISLIKYINNSIPTPTYSHTKHNSLVCISSSHHPLHSYITVSTKRSLCFFLYNRQKLLMKIFFYHMIWFKD